MDSSITFLGTITHRERQRRSFFDHLSHELDKVAASMDSVNTSLLEHAESYFAEGANPDTCVDLLILDGFSAKAARDYVNTRKMAAALETPDTTSSTYDFMFRDHRGRLIKGSEIGKSIQASNDTQALKKAISMMSSVEPPVEVIEVTKA